MISWFTTLSGWSNFGAAVGAILSLWALLGRLDKALLSHLAPFFVPRKQFERLEGKVDRIETKLDSLIQVQWARHNHPNVAEK